MEKLSGLVGLHPIWTIPKHTPDEWQQIEKELTDWEFQEKQYKAQKWLERSNIPPLFQTAALGSCDPKIQAWAASRTSDLIIEGKVGRGKSTSACAILLSLCPDHFCYFTNFDDILDDIKATFNGNGNEKSVINKYVNIELLCIDDFGKTEPTNWVLNVLWRIIDGRINRFKRTIFTTQYNFKTLNSRLAAGQNKETGLAIISRLSQAQRVELTGADRRLNATSNTEWQYTTATYPS